MSVGVTGPATIRVSDHLSLRLYPDSRPHLLENATLQKGLVLVFDGEELVEEGMGLGTPVVRYSNDIYFSSSAHTFVEHGDGANQVLKKSFLIDSVSRKRIWNGPFINARIYDVLHLAFARAYISKGHPNRFLTKLVEIRRSLGIRTQFVQTQSKGKVTISYRRFPNVIQVRADLSELHKPGCEEILIMNEAGSTFFTKYTDRNGLELVNDEIGAWNKVEATEASLSDFSGTLLFSLKKTEGADLYRGWERVKGRLSWAGLSYSMKAWKPVFEYYIRIQSDKYG